MDKVVDADGHIVEPRAVWTEYTEPEFRDRVLQVRRNDQGRDELWINGENRSRAALPLAASMIPGGKSSVLYGALERNATTWLPNAKLVKCVGPSWRVLGPLILSTVSPEADGPTAFATASAYFFASSLVGRFLSWPPTPCRTMGIMPLSLSSWKINSEML